MSLPITAKINKIGHLEIGGCDTVSLAAEYGTPLYVVDEATIRSKVKAYTSALKTHYPNSQIIFASKALSVVGVLKVIAEEGAGFDVSSAGELLTAIKAGAEPEKIYFHGNNKSRDEVQRALDSGVGRIVVDSMDELEMLDEVTKETGIKAKILLRINPGIEAHTHAYIKTGQTDSKFGIQKNRVMEAVMMAVKMRNIEFLGLHAHIGSQILKFEGFLAEIDTLMCLAKEISRDLNASVGEINIGGGLGISYTKEKEPDIGRFVKSVSARLKKSAKKLGLAGPKLLIEPGRSIAGQAGITLYSAGNIKDIPKIRKYVSVDGGMGDNIRPALYGAKYSAVVANRMKDTTKEKITIAGRYCESGDILIKDIRLPKISRGDVIAVLCTGAYGYTMANNYNKVPRPAVIMVSEGRANVILRRETIEDMLKNDVI